MTDYTGGDVPLPSMPNTPLEMSTTFVWMEINRRVDSLSHRVDRLDEHGTRGVDALRTEVARLRTDFVDHETSHEKARLEAVSGRRWLIGILLAAIAPLYPAIGTAIYFVLRNHG